MSPGARGVLAVWFLAPLGTKQRLVFDVYLYVGLRRGDAARLGKEHIRRGIVHLMTEKSQGKMPIYVPVHPALVASMKACPSSGLAVIAKDDAGSNYTKEALGNFFREAVEAAGIPVTKRRTKTKGYSGHGLRKASATIAARAAPPRPNSTPCSVGAATRWPNSTPGRTTASDWRLAQWRSGRGPHRMTWWGKPNSHI